MAQGRRTDVLRSRTGRSHVPAEAACDIDLWTDCIAGGLSPDDWREVVRGAGFVDVEMGPPVDAFGGAPGERNARRFDVYAHAFFARRPA